jgi:hypothetical protein
MMQTGKFHTGPIDPDYAKSTRIPQPQGPVYVFGSGGRSNGGYIPIWHDANRRRPPENAARALLPFDGANIIRPDMPQEKGKDQALRANGRYPANFPRCPDSVFYLADFIKPSL